MGTFEVLVVEDPTGEDAWRIDVAGEFDLTAADEFDRAVDQLIADGGRLVTLDLAETSFIDSSGLRAILRARSALAERAGRLTVARLSDTAQRVLEMTGVLDEFDRDQDS